MAAFAFGQTIQPGSFKHIIIVVQENRTPDNLFGASTMVGNTCGQEPNPLIPGADIDNGGYGWVPASGGTRQWELICNMSLPLDGWDAEQYNGGAIGPIDPDHSYDGEYPTPWGWVLDYNGGAMDGFCHGPGYVLGALHPCPSYSYVPAADPNGDITPYFSTAENYGFANYMFQSSEGPSQPAHQFLFTGTSAPVAPNDQDQYEWYWDFVAELASDQGYPAGCPYTGGTKDYWPGWVQPDGVPEPDQRNSECYAHDSLVTAAADCGPTYNCDRHIVSWGYYVEATGSKDQPSGMTIWDAPANIPEACYGSTSGSGNCGGTEWSNHILIPKGPIPYRPGSFYSWAPIFDDILACQLPAISWVIPDMQWSDHPLGTAGQPTPVYGPSWVADIIDVVGQSYALTNQNCDYWGVGTGSTNPEPTAIFVVWDDWGGWFDHVKPWIARQQNAQQGYTECDPPGQWGCGYTDGIRVPLVVSPYTPAGYVSGKCGVTGYPACGPTTSEVFPYVHDFGSILGLTEWNFGMPQIDKADKGYADYNAPDWQQNFSIPPLSDFFVPQGRTFTKINIPDAGPDYKCFQSHQKSGTCPLDSTWTPGPPDSY